MNLLDLSKYDGHSTGLVLTEGEHGCREIKDDIGDTLIRYCPCTDDVISDVDLAGGDWRLFADAPALLRENKMLREALEMAVSGETNCPGWCGRGCPEGYRVFSRSGSRSSSGALTHECIACRTQIALTLAAAKIGGSK